MKEGQTQPRPKPHRVTGPDDQVAVLPHEVADLRLLADKAKMDGRFDAGQRLHALLDAYEDREEAGLDREELEDTTGNIEGRSRKLDALIAALKGEGLPETEKSSAASPLTDRLTEVDGSLDRAIEALEEVVGEREGLRKRSAAIGACEQTIGHLVNALGGSYPEEWDHGPELLAIANASTKEEARALVLSFMDTLSPAKVYELAKLFNALAWALHHLNDQVNEALTA